MKKNPTIEEILSEVGRNIVNESETVIEKLNKAFTDIKNLKDLKKNLDLGSLIEEEGRLIIDLIENLDPKIREHPFTQWVLKNTTTSLGQRWEDLGSRYILDIAIENNLPKNWINDLTVRTLQEARKYAQTSYKYSLPNNFSKYHDNQQKRIIESYYKHHIDFKKYLENNPEILKGLKENNIETEFWEKSYTNYEDFSKNFLENLSNSPKTLPILHIIHPLSETPKIKEYLKRNTIQEDIRKQIDSFQNLQKFNNTIGRKQETSNHILFNGPPGTGKTTFARAIGRYFYDIGLIEKGHVLEISASAIIARYVGHTSHNMRMAIKEAEGGILFIDEFYHFADEDKFGTEALTTLLTSMGENNKFILIAAGYPEKNQEVLNLNKGLKDRFNRTFTFNHFTKDELAKILDAILKEQGLRMGKPAKEKMIDYLLKVKEDSEHYANARTLKKLFNTIVSEHADSDETKNLLENDNLSEQEQNSIRTLEVTSVEKAIETFNKETEDQNLNPMGFI